MSRPQDDALHKAAFLGPKGENADELERLLLEVLRDHVFWRRNFHPSDPRLIEERDKRTEAYDEMSARLRDELSQILARLKRAAPLYSPRQVAHIVSDPSLPALVGYFAGLLYNQNNVVAEVSPETVRAERAYFKGLAQMLGYPPFLPKSLPSELRTNRPDYSWGHLCSGGTVANLEALWIARNVRLYPLAVRLLAEESDHFAAVGELSVTTATGERMPLKALSTFQLSSLPTDAITDLHLRIKARLAEAPLARAEAFEEALPSVRNAGLASFLLRYNRTFPDDPARLPKVFISQAAHYCWKKNMDVVGLGANALDLVPVDERLRLDTDALRDRLQQCLDDCQPVLGVISIVGTTEEGAIDPLHEIEAVRDEMADAGLSFWHHCDAAVGGCFASLLPKTDDGTFAPVSALDDDLVGPDGLLPRDNVEALRHLPATDSVTIDPHKFGYVPYPAGAVLFRDYNVRDAIAYKAPYLADEDDTGFGGALGQWTLEGSRPGAAAVSCYLSQELVPLTPEGHGHFMRNCIETNQKLVEALRTRFGDETTAELSIRPFHPPETVAFCFVVAPDDDFATLAALNELNDRIWQRMTVDGREDINQYAFLLSRTEVNVRAYAHILDDLLAPDVLDAGVDDDGTLTLLRTCLMNPFQADWSARADRPFHERVADFVYDVAVDEYLEQVLPPFPPRDTERRPVLVIEQSPRDRKGFARHLEYDEKVASHFDVRAHSAAEIDTQAGADDLDAAADIVVHIDADAPSRMLHLLHTLRENGRVSPNRLIAVVTGGSSPSTLVHSLNALGLPRPQIIAEPERPTGARRLIMQLATRHSRRSSE
jgi:glutamate/tyrosine decarboxylase-like PLP-dependent enzyme